MGLNSGEHVKESIIIMGLQLASRGQCGLVTYDGGLDGHRQSIELNRNSAVLSSCTSFELLRCPAEPIDNGVVIRIDTMGWQMVVQQSKDIVTGVLWNVSSPQFVEINFMTR